MTFNRAAVRSDKWYSQLFQTATDVIYVSDLNDTILSVNNATETVTGRSRADLIGKHFSRIVRPEYLSTLTEMRDRLLAGHPAMLYQLELHTVDGESRRFEAASSLLIHDGEPVALQSILRDISERKHLEEHLWRAQKMEAVGQLAGGISHDFNNLLTIILGYSNLAQEQLRTDDPARGHIESLGKAVERATSLTRQLLAFSRRQMLHPRVLDLNVVVTDLQRLLTRLIGEHIVLTTSLAPDIGMVKADPGQLEQVVMNLVINSRDAMPNGGTIRIRTSNAVLNDEDRKRYAYVIPGRFTMMEITDSGHGMDEETISRIFEPFFSTKEAGRGTGLGLATVYGIVKQSGGYIWAQSQPGAGTTFRIYLPHTTEPPSIETLMSDNPAARLGGSEVLLLVEDEEELRLLLHSALSRAGFTVLQAANGDDALNISRGHNGPIHLVITDVVMPHMGGRSLATGMREERPQTPILYMSGYLNDSVMQRDGMDPAHFLHKPFDPPVLINKIREILDR